MPPSCEKWRKNPQIHPATGRRLSARALRLLTAQCETFSPRSGGELSYRPGHWNRINPHGLNCYDYAINYYDPRQEAKSQPGDWSNRYDGEPRVYTCPYIERRFLADHPTARRSSFQKSCPKGKRKIAMMVDPTPGNGDYHWMRQDRTGWWSHKMGERVATNLDGSGLPIHNPAKADRKIGGYHYREMCDYFCVDQKMRRRRPSIKDKDKNKNKKSKNRSDKN